MIIDRRNIADWRLQLVFILTEHKDPTNLLKEMVPEIGQLLALADAALRIRDAYKGEDGALARRVGVFGAVDGAMMDLDNLEEAALKAEGIVPLRKKS